MHRHVHVIPLSSPIRVHWSLYSELRASLTVAAAKLLPSGGKQNTTTSQSSTETKWELPCLQKDMSHWCSCVPILLASQVLTLQSIDVMLAV
mmetsp:Transcript_21219/g.36447  ORF Transcript_21219/g.36447 Transcript_21219/m.36447 type:complete len:92 (+) Transcript_21219:2046-2321(+)